MKASLLLATVLVSSSFLVMAGCSSTVSPPANSPKLSVPATIEFGKVRVGLTKDTSVRFTNNGTDALSITSQGFSASQFRLADTSQRTLKIDAGGYQDVRIRFMPTDSNSVAANDTINSNAGATVMALHGGGIALTRTLSMPATIDFGSVRLGLCEDSMLGMPRDTLLVMRNSGNDTLRISSVTAQPPWFTVISWSHTIAPGDSGLARLRFCPMQLGVVAGTITVASNATSDSILTITTSGNGLRYTPGVGSVYTFFAAVDSLDPATRKTVFIGAPGFHFDTIRSTNATFAGQGGLIEVSDPGPHDGYYKILPNGDVFMYGDGAPAAKNVFFGSGWWTLPMGSHSTNVSLFTGDTMVNGGAIKLHLEIVGSYLGDTTITVGSRQFPGSILQIVQTGTYGPSSKPNYQKGVQFIFLPALGYVGMKGFVEYSPVLNANRGAVAGLTAYMLR